MTDNRVLSADNFLSGCGKTTPLLDAFLTSIKEDVGKQTESGHRQDTQHLTHGFAWQATLVAAFNSIEDWIARLKQTGRFGKLEIAIANVAASELLSQLLYGTEMSQLEVFRANTDTLQHRQLTQCRNCFLTQHDSAVRDLFNNAFVDSNCRTSTGTDTELEQAALQFEAFADKHIIPFAQQWHLDDALIPDSLIQQLGDLGVFGLTIDESYGGSGFGKLAMCVVTEELSRGYVGVGSLSTRSEIAAELIQLAGSQQQKQRYLQGIAAGTILPTAVFTEPETGSDLASLQCRARRSESGDWQIQGNKTWITHAARSDLMTLLVRTDPQSSGYHGLSMLLVDKSRGSRRNPFPDNGLSGSEIGVLGYRGMREYDIAFDGFSAPGDAVLGNQEGQGFKQLMTTFEAARIQTAARAVGVARSAFEYALEYSRQRHQFGAPIRTYQRVYDKLIRMLTDIEISRQLTYAAAAKKDNQERCDIEAGMAKLFAAKTAWASADAAVQIHGGAGYAIEQPISRILADARILSIFEGTSEIQSEVIARRLLAT